VIFDVQRALLRPSRRGPAAAGDRGASSRNSPVLRPLTGESNGPAGGELLVREGGATPWPGRAHEGLPRPVRPATSRSRRRPAPRR